ncbi:MAG TPA: ABC transporter permease [Candidatus Saccharimonadales bacterium]|nr:ABC transporter permease [Candidatus Saccharimonadales bacterium]
MTLKQKLYTVWAFFTVSIKRLFRDRLALFFTFLFPLIFLFVFGALNKNNSVSISVAIINRSDSAFSKQYVQQAESTKLLKVDKEVKNFDEANLKMSRGEIEATIELPQNFGQVVNGVPSGQAIVHYTQNNEQAAKTLQSILQAQFQGINSKLVQNKTPFTVKAEETNTHSLSSFDYTFTGLLGFAILGAGIFGPMNYFPELKKMGILRRLHTTPLRVWQYFLSAMLSNAVTGLLSIALMLGVAIAVFHLTIVGNIGELAVFVAFGIVVILGIGLALGGWAKNERQAAPLGNIIVFPMMFLSGTFFPRFMMPEWLQNITGYMPLTPVIDGSRMILAEGKHLTDLGPQLLVMGVWCIIIYIIAFRVFRWE